MENKKQKIVFLGVVIVIVLFLGSYTYLVIVEEEDQVTITQPSLPEWQATETEYDSKLEALDALKEERPTTIPSAYPEHMMDEKGYFNPDYMEYEKQRIIDSIYAGENFKRPEPLNEMTNSKKQIPNFNQERKGAEKDESAPIFLEKSIQELGLEHQLFFASKFTTNTPRLIVPVEIMGNQTLKKDHRVRMQLTQSLTLGKNQFPRNTKVWGTVSFKPNRVLISVAQFGDQPIVMEAIDLQDGLEGIYVKNSFRSQATTEIMDDVVQDINIAGVPQVRGLKSIFQRSNRNVKVTLLDGHQFLLQSKNITK
ncbi:MAG: conjugative transposon protein TraM [Phaeodactylibacter sp.]|nr:conjugative transposon protein TraM [Phaeodactylibacter sp.]